LKAFAFMGKLRFHVSNADQIDPRVWQSAFITGIEGVPWHCRHQLQSDQFIIGRELDESGKINIVWPTQCCGNLCLSTSSLRESPQSYCLAVEVARGTVGRLKAQTADWLRMGLKLPEDFFPLAEGGQKDLLRCLTQPTDCADRATLAQSAIEKSIQASLLLCRSFAQQALQSRRSNEGPLTTLLGVNLPREINTPAIHQELLPALNLVNVQADLGHVEQLSGKVDFAPYDAQVDWAVGQHFKLCIGPLVDFRSDRLPKWMVLLGEDYQSILKTACRHAEETVKRYRGKAHIWNCAVGLNSPNLLNWSDEEVLRMAVAVISTVRQTDSRTPVILTIEQPWSEYLRDSDHGISPLHFADALIRADLGISGLALEMAFDRWPGGSLPRDLIEVSRQIDRWAMLGMPLMVYLSSPTEPSQRNGASQGNGERVADWNAGFVPNNRNATSESVGFVPPDALIQLLLSKPCIHAVVWNQFSDQFPVDTPSSGLWDREGHAKPLIQQLAAIRQRNLL
jgi:hypothetical protein